MSIENNQRDLASVSPQQFLDYWWSKRNIDLHTQIPAKVVEVDYIKNSVKVQPLIKTFINNSQALAMEQIDVPMSLLSTGVGGASITLPVKAGCVGLLKFSERDTTNWINGVGNEVVEPLIKDNLSMGVKVYPVSFEVGLFTPASAIEWDSENVVIKHGNHKITLPLLDSEPILINGVKITPDGNVITALGTDLDKLKADFDKHIHVAPSGGGNTGLPIPKPIPPTP